MTHVPETGARKMESFYGAATVSVACVMGITVNSTLVIHRHSLGVATLYFYKEPSRESTTVGLV